jgi:hypothetical protein
MKIDKLPQWVWIAAAAGVVVLYVIKKGGIAGAVAGVTSGAVGVAGSAAGGVVLGVGDILGVPRTDVEECKACISRGDNVGASKSCSAGVFAKWQYLSVRKNLTGQTFTMSDIFN